jgi:hypothetical protein
MWASFGLSFLKLLLCRVSPTYLIAVIINEANERRRKNEGSRPDPTWKRGKRSTLDSD